MEIQSESRVGVRSIPHRQYLPVTEEIPVESPGLYPGEPESCRRRWREFLAIAVQLGILLAVFQTYRLETTSFRLLALVAFGTLPAHYLAPYRWKKPLFVAASILGMILVVGPSAGAWVMAGSAVLIGIAVSPIRWHFRAGSIAAVAAVLAALRPALGHSAESASAGVIPVLASMFMFRMMIYLYELKHAGRRESLVDTLGYFFLLPNFSFLHFPVVDYRTLQRGYFARDIHEIQHAGLEMMSRGTIQLLLYRVIYLRMLIPAEAVHNLSSLLGYLACNYLLYLRVSGQFHMACGMLHLFGFQLPETHHRYLLATGFTDYWRRVNIYWKDFMVRLVFNPVVFRLKRRPQPLALAVATAVVFLVTWLLHAYQSFWLRGAWGFGAPDALFWGILGVLVLINVQLDARRGSRKPQGSPRTPLARTIRAAKVAGTFLTIALLWSLWSSPSVGAWIGMLRRGLRL